MKTRTTSRLIPGQAATQASVPACRLRADNRSQGILLPARALAVSARCVLVVLLLTIPGIPRAATAAGTQSSVQHNHRGLAQALAVLVDDGDSLLVTAPDGREVTAHRPDTPRIPASVLKLLTALAALEIFGPDHRFATDCYQDAAGHLYIRGYGDPLLTSEAIQTLAGNLARRISRVEDLVLDDGYFDRPLTVPGVSGSSNPYDAPNGALCANFNTIVVTRRSGRYVSGEKQTPLVPFAHRILARRPVARGRIVLTHREKEATLYAGHLLTYFLREAGRAPRGRIRLAPVPPGLQPVYRFRSPVAMIGLIRRLLAYSNNFVANQLVVAMGARLRGAPGTLDTGVAALQGFAWKRLGLRLDHLVEGSGIARQNRMTARDLMAVLDAFAPHRSLLRRAGRQRYKTGHLNGVRSRAGYLESVAGGHYRFVVLINTPGKRTEGIMEAIEHYLP